MLTSAQKELIASLLKVSVADFDKANTDAAEATLTIPEGLQSFTTEEITQRDDNLKKEGKKDAEKGGIEIGKELAAKDVKKAFGIEVEGKDITKIVEAAKAQLSKGDEGLKEQITLLQKKNGELEIAVEDEKKNTEGAVRKSTLLSKLPANKSDLLSNEEHLDLVQKNLEFTADGIKYKGKILRDDKTQDALDENAAIQHFYTERKLLKEEAGAQGGRGGGDRKAGAVYGKMSELRADWEGQGKSLQGQEFAKKVEEVVKSNPDFDSEN